MKKTDIGAFLLCGLLLVSCGGGLTRQTETLLARDYQTMSDAELQHYYRQLGDQLARQARADRKSGGEGEEEAAAAPADQLRQRWNAVRLKMQQRDLLSN